MASLDRHSHKSQTPGASASSWHLLSDEELYAERKHLLERQRRFMEIAAAINASNDPDRVLRLVRDAIVESSLFDRAGVWVLDEDYFCGAWGTDAHGGVRDEHRLRETFDEWDPLVAEIVAGKAPYLITAWTPSLDEIDGPTGTLTHAIVALHAGHEILGVISVDNLLTRRPVTEEDVASLLPFADMAAAAIRSARMTHVRDALLERQRRLMQLAAGMNASLDLDDILRMVRDAVVEADGFDRASVYLVDQTASLIRGAWGTNRAGQLDDIHHNVFGLADAPERPLWRVANGEEPYALTEDLTNDGKLAPDHPMYGVHAHAVVPMRTAGEIVGVLCVDNLLSGRPIRETNIEEILPFTEQAALAIQNARLFQDLHRAQDALVRAEKLRALGEMAGGLAHNINNLLTAVLGYAELIRQQPDLPANVDRYAGIIERAGTDGAEIVRRVQHFAQQEMLADFDVIDLCQVVRDAAELAKPHWQNRAGGSSEAISLHLDLTAAGVVRVAGAAPDLRQVVINLLRNAADAMTAGGSISVSCRSAGHDAILEVADTGIGMEEATRKRVFEPFFTTKGPAIGQGLGLSVAWGIIIRHSGTIFVESKPGVGTTFRIHLPLAQPPPAEDQPAERPRTLEGIRILLVDDEVLVLESLSRLLENCGASVHAVVSAEDALAWLEQNPAGCDLVMTDQSMPGMTGQELLRTVRDRYPSLSRVLISGLGTLPPDQDEPAVAEVSLTKPISREALIGALAEMLNHRGSAPE